MFDIDEAFESPNCLFDCSTGQYTRILEISFRDFDSGKLTVESGAEFNFRL